MRRTWSILGVAIAALSFGAFGCGGGDDSSTPGGPGDASPDSTTSGGEGGSAAPQLKHIFYIMMENHSRTEIVGNAQAPFITSLASKYGQATSYYGVTHPSLPNYLAAFSGDFQGIWDDCAAGPMVTCTAEEFIPADAGGDMTSSSLLTAAQAENAAVIPHWFSGRNLVDQLEQNGKTWIAYMDGIPGTGDTSEYWPYATNDAGGPDLTNPRKLYAQKHDPFMYFQDIRTNANRMSKIVPFTQFATDITGTKVPNFVWISPNQCNDMHGLSTANATAVGIAGCDTDSTTIGIGDTFVKNTVTSIMASPAWSDGAAIVIVWDEDDYQGTAGCCNSPMGQTGYLGGANVPAIVISSLLSSPVTSSDPYNHYSLLATIENLWGFDCLANACGMKGSQLMTKLFVPTSSDAGAPSDATSAAETGSDSAAASETGADAGDAGTASETGSPSEAGSTDASDSAAPVEAGSTDASDAAPVDAATGG